MGFACNVQSEIAFVKYNKTYDILHGLVNFNINKQTRLEKNRIGLI